MKQNLLLIYFCIISIVASAQNKDSFFSKLKFDVNTAYLYNLDMNLSTGTLVATSLITHYNRHSLLAGPVWWFTNYKYDNTLHGVLTSYRYNAGSITPKMKFYLMADLMYEHEKTSWSRYIQYNSQNFYTVNFEGKWQSMVGLGGYGIDLRLYKRLYLTHSFTLGMEFYQYTSRTIVPAAPQLNTDYASGNIFADSRKRGMMRVGLSYAFHD